MAAISPSAIFVSDVGSTPRLTPASLKVQTFVAHAISDANIMHVLRSQKLCCAEDVMRSKGFAEYEAGSNYRKKKHLPTLRQDHMDWLASVDKEISLNRRRVGKFLEIKSFSIDFLPTVEKIAKELETNGELVSVAYDHQKPEEERIDRQLARIFEEASVLDENTKWESLDIESFINARATRIKKTKLAAQIRVAKESICWQFGKVVICRLNPAPIMGVPVHEQGHLVYGLLEPYQNKGEFFRLDITDKDVLVLAPSSTVASYQEERRECVSSALGDPGGVVSLIEAYDQIPFNVFCYEEMSLEDMDFLKVPTDLRRKIRPFG